MKRFAIAYVSFFDNDCQVHFVESDNEINAIKNFLISLCGTEDSKQSQTDWNETCPDNVEDIKDELVNMEIGLDIKEIV